MKPNWYRVGHRFARRDGRVTYRLIESTEPGVLFDLQAECSGNRYSTSQEEIEMWIANGSLALLSDPIKELLELIDD